MFPSASKLFSGMNMGAHIAHDPKKNRKKSSGIILEESEGGSMSMMLYFADREFDFSLQELYLKMYDK